MAMLRQHLPLGSPATSTIRLDDAGRVRKVRLNYAGSTDTGLVHLTGLTNLETLVVIDTQVIFWGCAKLRKALPNCDIRGWTSSS